MTTTQPAPQLPFDRPDILQVAPLYEVLRREAPIVAVRTPAGLSGIGGGLCEQ